MDPILKLYAERNTGSNYLKELLRLNIEARYLRGTAPAWAGRLQSRLPGAEWVRDAYFASTYRHNLGWKHRAPEPAAALEQRSLARKHRLAIVVLVKSPYSWLVSMHRSPHHQYVPKGTSFSDFLRLPWKTLRREGLGEITLPNPVALWNTKHRRYLDLDGLAFMLRYEDLVAEPERCIDRIAEHFSFARSSPSFRNYTRATKSKPYSSDYYRSYYAKETWRSEMCDADIDFINEQVDPALMERLGYSLSMPG
jgi:hypothetical protein